VILAATGELRAPTTPENSDLGLAMISSENRSTAAVKRSLERCPESVAGHGMHVAKHLPFWYLPGVAMPPQPHNTPEEERHLEEPRRRVVEEPDAHSSNSPWLWPVVILLALLLWLGFWTWTSYRGWWARHSHKGGLSANSEGILPRRQPSLRSLNSRKAGSPARPFWP
jgi:hypothetical protein